MYTDSDMDGWSGYTISRQNISVTATRVNQQLLAKDGTSQFT